ncbi:MAG: putative DNA binding domain-containing protein [Magnetococcales bacterium]|nr:putative DNA binding domain-containing protein [Magnetococcales bacterium]
MFDGAEELLRKIQLGEDTSLELKTVVMAGNKVKAPSRADLADEIAAIANTARGVIVFGVDDKTREITGIPRQQLDDVERYVFEVCHESIKPPVLFRSLRMELPDTMGSPKAVLKVEIPRSLFVHKSPGGYFHRQGSSKREMDTPVLSRLLQQRSQAQLIRFDEQPVPGTARSDLDEVLLRRFLKNPWGPACLSAFGIDGDLTTVHKLGLLKTDDEGTERATVAGVLMCSRKPAQWMSSAFIMAVRYRGVRQDSNQQLDAMDIHGPLDEQIRQSMLFVRRNMSVAAKKRPGRVEIPQFSTRAIFEAIVNAVAHRDYSISGSKIRLFMFDDRLELYSPGALPNTMTIESLPLRQFTRNELLTTLLGRCPVEEGAEKLMRQYFMEKRGEGVPIIMDESFRISGRLPEYRLLDHTELLLAIHAANATDFGHGEA